MILGSRRLLEVADSVEEVQTGCQYCSNKAVLNLKHVNGVANTEGPTVQLGAEEKYYPVCFSCYRTQLLKSGQVPVEAWKDGSSFTPTSIPSTPYISPTAN